MIKYPEIISKFLFCLILSDLEKLYADNLSNMIFLIYSNWSILNDITANLFILDIGKTYYFRLYKFFITVNTYDYGYDNLSFITFFDAL